MNAKLEYLLKAAKSLFCTKIYTLQSKVVDFMFCCITSCNFEHFCGVLEKNSQEHDLKSQTMIKNNKKVKKAPYCNVGLKWISCFFSVKEKQVYILVWIFFIVLPYKKLI